MPFPSDVPLNPNQSASGAPVPAAADDVLTNAKRFEKIFESLPNIAVQGYRADGTILYWNRANESVYGYTAEEAIGRNLLDLIIPPEMRNAVRAAIAHGAATGEMPPAAELELLRKDGTRVPVFSSHAVVRGDGAEPELFCLDLDLRPQRRQEQERRQTLAALRDNEERLRLALSGSGMGLFDLNLQTGRATITPEYAAMLGYDAATFTADTSRWAELAHPDDRARAMGVLQECVQGTRTEYSMEYRLRAADGSWKWIQSTGRIVGHDAAGRPSRLIGVHSDITARKLAETRLAESARLYEDLVGNLPLGVYRIAAGPDGSFRFAYVSDRYCEIVGLPREQLLANPQAAVEVIHPDDRAAFEAHNLSSLAHGRPFHWVGRILVRGAVRWLSVESNPTTVPGGSTTWSGIVIDVTERRAANQALEVFRFATDSAADAVFWMREDGSFWYVNEQACQSLGYTREELLSRSVFDVDPHVTPAWWAEAWRKFSAREIGRNQLETTHRRKDGSLLPVEISSKHFWFGPQELHVAYARDISARRQAETALRESELFLSRSQTVAQIGSYKFDVANGTWIGTPQLDRIFGIGPDHPHTAAGWLDLVAPADREDMRRHLFEHVLAGRNRFEREYRILRPADGQERWVFGHGELEFDDAGRPVRMIGTIQDITERHAAQDSRIELERRLLHAQKLESLGVLAGGIAHDFNNLLLAILGNLDLALLDLPSGSPARKTIQQSVLAARRAADLTRQMLAYSGRGAFDIRETDLGELVAENAHLFRACISKLVTLQIHAAPRLPRIQADPGQVQQVVMNLITNASEAIGDRAGVVQFRTGVLEADAATLARSRCEEIPAPGSYVFLEVEDTGCGMDETTQQKLFDPFFTTKFTGRGLGMSAILGIVRGHRGAIFVDSEVGRGTTVRVLFPAGRLPGEKEAAPAAPGAANRPSARGRVLIVDDEEVVRQVCRHMLTRHGWTTIEAADGPQALSLFQTNGRDIDCVLLDLSMPGMSGVEVFRELRQLRPGIRVVLTSGYSSDRRITAELTSEGLAGFIQKPFTVDALLQAIDRAVAK